ncbi:MAG TPA: helix-turn-helix transcriptional regulator [Pirellulaceae bacterium]|nr:helix-turn-helix transcriptional regulator [Pirellulaceae bacterium]HMO93640.1 helix-turn-helix transcriptional regulator [Pirellulaceae bacterium]HMP71400.1 helix-turn-helix transcriptional regulator [Pirellulaceae bacterium]
MDHQHESSVDRDSPRGGDRARHLSRVKAANGSKGFGEIPLPQELWSAIVNRLGLSPRLIEVIEALFCGLDNRDVANSLGITLSTFRTYLTRIFEKTGTRSRLELVLYVVSLANELGVWSVRVHGVDSQAARKQSEAP